jgi:hypothetical protein
MACVCIKFHQNLSIGSNIITGRENGQTYRHDSTSTSLFIKQEK